MSSDRWMGKGNDLYMYVGEGDPHMKETCEDQIEDKSWDQIIERFYTFSQVTDFMVWLLKNL